MDQANPGSDVSLGEAGAGAAAEAGGGEGGEGGPDAPAILDPGDASDEVGGGAADGSTAGGVDSPLSLACDPGFLRCGDACVDPSKDPNHCGDCSTVCRGGKSCHGTCTCPAGQTDCNGVCSDTSSDPNNCLVCGARCTGGKACDPVNGCECPGGKLECQGLCVDTSSSPLDCGKCDNACAAGFICTSGKCGCPPDQKECSPGLCVDTTVSPSHCGACGHACGASQVCTNGQCVCATGTTDCGNGTCTDILSDPVNCGVCGTTCEAGRVCNAGTCSTLCAADLTNCDGACVDLQTSDLHCGACSTACQAGSACSAAECRCTGGRSYCSGACADLQSDNLNCGACGTGCPRSSSCAGGTCNCISGYALCGGACVDSLWSNDHCGDCVTTCKGGKMCNNGTCVCPPPQVECNGVCVDTMTDLGNCGACGHGCTTGTCSAGVCTCPLYQSECGGQCIPTANDPQNCGSCQHICASNQVCISGACQGSCYGGLSACNGTCVDLASDRNHCGSCAGVCATGQGCAGGTCVPSVPVGAPPAKCTQGGPPILLTTDGTTQACAGQTAATTFPWAICTCDSFSGKGSQTFDAFDSARAPYAAGGLGGGVGVNGSYSGGSSMSCTGTLWSLSSINPGNATVRQELHVGGLLDGNVGVTGTGYVVTPHDRGSFAGDLYTRSCPATGYSVAGACFADPGLTVPAPCQRCDGGNQVPVQGYVSYYAQALHNDNAAIGLAASALNSGGAATVLDLPCGYYYLDRIVAENSMTIAAHGNTALFVGGGIDVKGALVLALDASSRFDVFVAGAIFADGTLNLGSAAYPANLRLYVGGACKATGATCAQKADCCSASCTGGVCGGADLLPGDPPWSIYMKAATNIAADIYTPNGEMYAGASFAMYGAIFAGDYKANGSTTIHYDRAAIGQGIGCPPTTGCKSCLDCGNQACVNGSCGSCTSDNQCCPPLLCVDGRCSLGGG